MDLGCLKCDARQDCVVDDGDLWGSEPANMRQSSVGRRTWRVQTSAVTGILSPLYGKRSVQCYSARGMVGFGCEGVSTIGNLL
jgi:hypothetical protein